LKIICQRDEALRGVRIAQNAVTSTALPILSHLLLSTREKLVEITATNLETTICSSFEAIVEEEGEVCLPGERLYSILRELPSGEFSIETDDAKSLIKMGQISFALVGISSEEFPEIPSGVKTILSLPQKVFQEILVKTMFSAGQDEVRQSLSCLLLENSSEGQEKEDSLLRVVATDGRRLSSLIIHHSSSSESFKVLIPLRAAKELSKILSGEKNIEMGLEENRIFFRTPKFSFFSQLVEAKFPNYKSVIPKDYKVIFEVQKDDFVAAIKRVSLLSEEQTRLVKFNLTEDSLDISAASVGLGSAQEKLPVTIKGEKCKMEVGFNAVFLLEALRVMEGENIEVRLIDQESPGVFSPIDQENYLHLLMPVKLTEE